MVFGEYIYPAQLITVDWYPLWHLAWLISISDLPCLQPLPMYISKVYPYPKKHIILLKWVKVLYIYIYIYIYMPKSYYNMYAFPYLQCMRLYGEYN